MHTGMSPKSSLPHKKTIQTSSLNGKDQMGWDRLFYYYKVSNFEAFAIFPILLE
jgi:hypothetical protein